MVGKSSAFFLTAILAILPRALPLTITEINYDPPGTPQEKGKLKFIEIFNDSPATVDLTGYHFGEGVIYTFSDKYLLGGRKYLVLCADEATIQGRYGIQNTIGPFLGNLSEDGDKLVILDEGGGTAASVDFRDRGKWTSIPRGTGYTLSLRNPFLPIDEPESWTASGLPGGTPGAENFPPPYIQETEVFGDGTDLVYRKGWDGSAMAPFSDPADAWQKPGFDDSSWTPGTTPIGYGDTGDATILDDMKDKYIAFAVRKRFTLTPEALAELDSAVLRMKVDDGFVAYLNGTEISRTNVGTDTQVSFDKAATGSREITTTPMLVPIPKEKILPGENLLAVQVHNRTLADLDAGLAPSLAWRKLITPSPGPSSPVRLNEILRDPPSGNERWLELYNSSGSVVADLSGFTLTDDPSQVARFVFPAQAKIAPHGFLALGESEIGIPLAGTGSRRELRLYLFEADRSTIADAAILEMRPRIVPDFLSQARIPDGGPSWFLSTTPTRLDSNGAPLERDVVVNEIMYHPMTSPQLILPDGNAIEQGEYVEIYNRSARPIPLENWAFTKGINYLFPDDLVLGPGEYLVLGPDPEYLRQTYSLPEKMVLGPEPTPEARAAFGTLSNSGETIEIEDPLGNPIQSIRYHEGGEWNSLADGGGSSLELIDPFQDNVLPSAWDASDETARAPWTQYTYTGTYVAVTESEFWIYLLNEGECLIDEVSVKKSTTEYIPNGSFENATTVPWRMTGTHIRSRKTTDEAHAGSACLQVVASGGGDNRVNKVEVDTTPAMTAGSMTVSFWARWLNGSQRLQTSAFSSGFNSPLAMNHLLSVPKDLGTPGRENSARANLRKATGSDDMGPAIGLVKHIPPVPAPADPVTITARISDPDGVKEARIEYRINKKSAPLSTEPMLDDGQHGDGEPGDGIFGGTIPVKPLGSRILFNIAAKDSGDRERRLPVDAPDHTLLYQVSNSFVSPAARFRIILNDDDDNTLKTRLLHSDDLVDSSIVFEESEVYYNVGLRYHGSPWNRPPDPKMFSIRFNGDKPYRGFSRINIGRYGSQPNESTSYQLVRLAALGERARTPYAPRYEYSKVYYNGNPHSGTALSAYVVPSRDYFRANFPLDGDGFAYKITGKLEFNDAGAFTNAVTWTQFRYYGPSKESYRYFYNPATRDDEDNFDPLISFLTTIDPSKTSLTKFEDPVQGIESICNVESFLRVLIIRTLHDDWDCVGIGNGQNAYVYYAPVEGRFYFVPWDMDHTFGDSNARLAPQELNVDPGILRFVSTSSKYRREYLRIMKEVTGKFWSTAGMTPWLDAVAAEMKGGIVGSPTAIKSFMTARASVLRTRLPQIFRDVKFAITQPPGGKDVAVKASEATIAGTAPLTMAKIYYAPLGEELVDANPTWVGTSGTDWRIKLPLKPDKNTFQLIGFDSEGAPLGDVLTIDIFDATNWTAPSITKIEPSNGPVGGGTAVTITGDGFREGITVAFGTAGALQVDLRSPSELTLVAPAASGPGQVDVKVLNIDGQSALSAGGFLYESTAPTFVRGDFDRNSEIDLTDVVDILNAMFFDWQAPCLEAGDIDDSGDLDINDPTALINYLFLAGNPPRPPFPDAGPDPTPDSLGCSG